LIARRDQLHGTRARRPSRLTARGERAVRLWLSRRPSWPPPIRDEIFVRFLAAERHGPEAVQSQLDRQEAEYRRYLALIHEEDARAGSSVTRRMAHEAALGHAEAHLRWLARCRELIGAPAATRLLGTATRDCVWGRSLVGAAGHALAEDHLHLVGAPDVEVLAVHLLEEDPAGDRLVEDLGERELRLQDGDVVLKTALVQAAWAAARTPGSYPQAQYLRLKARRGPKKAIVAVASSLLTAAYFILRDGVPYHDLGSTHFERRNKTQAIRRLVRRLADLGCSVQIMTAA
jgi:transposase